MSSRKQTFFPAQAFTQKRAKAAYRERFLAWKDELPEDFLEEFYCEALVPFLKQHGYEVGVSKVTGVKYLAEWAQSHVEIQRRASESLDRTFCYSVNSGGVEEADWYHTQIHTSEWLSLAHTWRANELFDDSEAGLAQSEDLSSFAWQIISLEGSKAHSKWLDIIESPDDDEGWTPVEESVAQAGDRRTT